MTRSDEAATRKVVAALDRVHEIEPATASEDFSLFSAAWNVPAVFCVVGGIDPDQYKAAEQAGKGDEIPANHAPNFAPVINPTLRIGIETMLALLVAVLDLTGTLVFAMSGAALGVQKDMDLFGVLVLAFVTAVVGGITRDVLIGAVPRASVASWHNLALAVAAGLLVFRFPKLFDRLQHPVLFFDAAPLARE